MQDLSEKYLMMIEPKGFKSSAPTIDRFTPMAEKVFENCRITANYKGHHVCRCGEPSDNHDYQTVGGRITNSLMLHYLKWHRDEIPQVELSKIIREWNLLHSNRGNMTRSGGQNGI